ncbi:MAG: ATP-binding protein [Candidatus Hydrogenedentes bacterium]|nr:ATP-binding protein [Candidatus Hydrogenedentota bacterium]
MAAKSWPGWVSKLEETYLAGGSSMFILHGNVADLVASEENGRAAFEPLTDFLTRRLFGAYDLVLHYDLGRGLRAYSGGDPQRLTRMNNLLDRVLGDRPESLNDPTQAFRLIDRLVSLLLVTEDGGARKVAVLVDYVDFVCPAEDRPSSHLATFLNWARSPVIRRVNVVFVLMTESLARLNATLVQSGYTDEVAVPLPTTDERKAFVLQQFPDLGAEAERLATLSAGLTLANLDTMLRRASRAKKESAKGGVSVLPDQELVEIKKSLMEAQCPGLIEFVEPKFDLSMVAGHKAAKERLVHDARLVREGKLESVPMGYLVCGPVGVGKTFLALCYAGTIGIPCITIRNFRSKYVGETEANLERILSVVRELGPVAVIVDEADAALGNRTAEGDSGTSARVFAQLASQMGNTQYRGKIIWFLLTCRPDLLPIDLKRQGRCEEHIPLFYPETAEDRVEMFLAMGRKLKMGLTKENLPDLSGIPPLSGADIESVLTRVRRESVLQNLPLDAALIGEVVKNFRSMRSEAHELQWLAAILESTDLRYLPDKIRSEIEKPGIYEAFARKLRELQALEDRALAG